MHAARLFDGFERWRERWTGTRALEVLDPKVCPACGDDLWSETVEEPALLRHGGYGATRKTTTLHCHDDECRWSLTREVTEVRPIVGPGSRPA